MISGTSLSELLASGGELRNTESPDIDTGPTVAEASDPNVEQKLLHAREEIIRMIRERRPRFVASFEQMEIRNNTIAVRVPTSELHDEMLRSKTELLMQIQTLAGITGRIDLDVAVDDEVRKARPIKLEDRVRYISEKNPLVTEFRKALDLELE